MFLGSALKAKQRRFQATKRRTNTCIKATSLLPRLVVTRSLVHISAQIIAKDGQVVVAATDTGLTGTKTEKAFAVGELIAQKAVQHGVQHIVFDRNGRVYHGRVASLASGARSGGLQF